MRLGITSFATMTGLGYQTYDYYKHLKPDKTLQIDLSKLNGAKQHDWYPDAQRVEGYPQEPEIRQFLEGLDVVLFAETPLNYEFYTIAREMGVKTATVINFEFFDNFVKDVDVPDMFIMPSMWHLKDIQEFGEQNGVEVVQLHHPVDRHEFPFHLRTMRQPLHIAGNPAAHDRNGTWDFMQACPDGRVVTQSEDLAQRIRKRYKKCDVFTNIDDNRKAYRYGDILVLPRRYGGNCLPLNEALSSGMPVIMPDISPNNHILPKEWLVPAKRVGEFHPRTTIDLYSVNPHDLADKLKETKQWDMPAESYKADMIAEQISWDNMRDKYQKTLEQLCESTA